MRLRLPGLLLLLCSASYALGCDRDGPAFVPPAPVPCGGSGQLCCDPDAPGSDAAVVLPCVSPWVCQALVGRPEAAPRCQSCPADRIACEGSCVDPSLSAHCGACDGRCPADHACEPVARDAGPPFACVIDCISRPGTTRCEGRCVDPRTDRAHCGGCGARCDLPYATSGCAAGACTVETCHAGYVDCDGEASNGCEVDTRSDPLHCGACGQVCVLPHATAACSAGACRFVACAQGYGDCDGDPSNGCEVATHNDLDHCGRCGQRCPRTEESPAICVGGICGLDPISCTRPLASCDDRRDNGCEVNTATDPTHCGGCRHACTAPDHGSAACVDGVCSPRCDPGFVPVEQTCVPCGEPGQPPCAP